MFIVMLNLFEENSLQVFMHHSFGFAETRKINNHLIESFR